MLRAFRDRADESVLRPPVVATVLLIGVLGLLLGAASLLHTWPFGGVKATPAQRSLVARTPNPSAAAVTPAARVSAPPSPVVASDTHQSGVFSPKREVQVRWSNPSSGSAIAGYSFEWSETADTLPDDLRDLDADVTTLTSAPLPDGSWWFHLRAVDDAGHWSPAAHAGPFLVGVGTPAPAAGPSAAPSTSPAPSPAPAVAPTSAPAVAPPVARTPEPTQRPAAVAPVVTAAPTARPATAPPAPVVTARPATAAPVPVLTARPATPAPAPVTAPPVATAAPAVPAPVTPPPATPVATPVPTAAPTAQPTAPPAQDGIRPAPTATPTPPDQIAPRR